MVTTTTEAELGAGRLPAFHGIVLAGSAPRAGSYMHGELRSEKGARPPLRWVAYDFKESGIHQKFKKNTGYPYAVSTSN